jgi:hypothetical protein
MKKLLGIGILAMLIIALMVVPVLATECGPGGPGGFPGGGPGGRGIDIFIDEVEFEWEYEWNYEFTHNEQYNFIDFCCDKGGGGLELEGLFITEKAYNRFDLIDVNAFQNAEGIITVQQAAGNGILQQANVDVDINKMTKMMRGYGGKGSKVGGLEVEGLYLLEKDYSRFDKISGNAFQNAVGITTVQMSSGNGNIQQANISLDYTKLMRPHHYHGGGCR